MASARNPEAAASAASTPRQLMTLDRHHDREHPDARRPAKPTGAVDRKPHPGGEHQEPGAYEPVECDPRREQPPLAPRHAREVGPGARPRASQRSSARCPGRSCVFFQRFLVHALLHDAAHRDIAGSETERLRDLVVRKAPRGEHEDRTQRQRKIPDGGLQADRGLHAGGQLVGARQHVGDVVGCLDRLPPRGPGGEMRQGAVGGILITNVFSDDSWRNEGKARQIANGDVLQQLFPERRSALCS